jgi:hypothetical protein
MPPSTPAILMIPPVRGEVAAQQPETSRLLERLADRKDDVVIRSRRIQTPHLIGQRLAGARQAAPIEEARVEELLHDDREAAL